MFDLINQQSTNIQQQPTAELSKSREYGLGNILGFPTELASILPQTVWETLNEDQKVEILLQRGLFKYLRKLDGQFPFQNANEVNPATQAENLKTPDQLGNTVALTEVDAPQGPVAGEIDLTQKSINEKAGSDFAKQVETIKQIEAQGVHEDEVQEEKAEKEEKASTLTIDEKIRVEQEKASNANQPKAPTFFGYQPSQATITNAVQIADNGDTSDSKTWAATILKKLFAIFGN